MTFDILHSDLEDGCNCIEGLLQDVENTYVRRISKKNLKENDLKSHWERGKIPEVLNTCKEKCNYKSLSINLVNDQTEGLVLEFYKASHAINPNIKYICKFKFYEDAGVVKVTPLDGNPNHMDFYKCDNFSKEKINIIDVIEL